MASNPSFHAAPRRHARPVVCVNMDVHPGTGSPKFVVNATYVDALWQAGAEPSLASCLDTEYAELHVARADAFLFIGGKDYHPDAYGEPLSPHTAPLERRRHDFDLLLARLAIDSDKPILGICGGHQLINIALGGKLVQHVANPTAHGHGNESYHMAAISGGKILRGLFGESRIRVNSSHHQAIAPAALGDGLVVTAIAEDGTVEAVEGENRAFLLGVQWHPERIDDHSHRTALFGALVAAVRKS